MSVPATTLRKLAALGLSSGQMAGVLDILADGIEAEEARKEAQRQRTRKARERQRNVTTTLQSHHGNSDDTHGRVTRAEDKTSNLEIEPLKQESKKAARGTRLPDDFVPDIGFAISEGMPEARAKIEAASFCDFWRAKPGAGGLKLDWSATWRVWVRKSMERLSPRAGPIAKPNPTLDAAKALMEKLDAAAPSQIEANQPYPRLVAFSSG